MANKNAVPPKQHQFKKGKVANPNGGRTHNPAVRALKKLTIDTYREVIELVLTGNIQSLKDMAQNPATPALQVGIATAFMKAIKDGDYGVIERIAERIVGKIPDQLVVNSTNLNANLNNHIIDRQELKAAIAKLETDV